MMHTHLIYRPISKSFPSYTFQTKTKVATIGITHSNNKHKPMSLETWFTTHPSVEYIHA